MYRRYEIPAKEAPARYALPARFNVIVRKRRLASMLLREAIHYRFNRKVVLSRPCIYGVFGGRLGGFKPRQEKCTACLRCKQEYPDVIKDIIVSPEFLRLGDEYFTPSAMWAVNREATTGGDITRGMGYQGPFAGDGFDAMWTDMSEIVRPTRHGKLGTEYISTEVEIGRKPQHVQFDESGKLLVKEKTILTPVPILFDHLPATMTSPAVLQAVIGALEKVGNYAILPVHEFASMKNPAKVIPLVRAENLDHFQEALRNAPAFEYEFAELSDFARVRRAYSDKIVIARFPFRRGCEDIASRLVSEEADGLHLYADYHGRETQTESPRHIQEVIRVIHGRLVSDGVRDSVTLIGSGGIIRAEHVAKAIICGLDLVGVDTAILQALQAVFHGEVRFPASAKVTVRPFEVAWGGQRLANLVNSWKEQLIEVMSAMGMRDVRRLRGETGRAMIQQIEEEEFVRYLNESIAA